MPRQAEELPTVNISGGVGGNGGEGDGSDLTRRVDKHKRRRLNDEDEIEIIPRRNLKLIREIGSGPGYLFHAGENKGHAVVVKVFNRGPRSTVRRQLESTVALSKGIMHPNLLPLLGISSPESFTHFIVYENVHWQNAEGPLAVALKNDLGRSVTLGFKMVAGLSAGLNHLLVQGVFARMMGAENFDIFLDVDDRFVISVHPQLQEEGDVVQSQEREGNAWTVFNALCSKTLTSANRILYQEEIHRVPTILDDIPSRPTSNTPALSLWSLGSAASLQNTQEGLDVPPRREYVWRSTDRGQQSLENITRRMTLDLDMEFSSLRRINQTNGRTPHRCAGYVREEITLATTTRNSAVVAHDAPSASERCLICHEIVDLHEEFRCECGGLAPGSQHTIKCQVCKFWSHSGCVENSDYEFICRLCMRSEEQRSAESQISEEEEIKKTERRSWKQNTETAPPPPASGSSASAGRERRRSATIAPGSGSGAGSGSGSGRIAKNKPRRNQLRDPGTSTRRLAAVSPYPVDSAHRARSTSRRRGHDDEEGNERLSYYQSFASPTSAHAPSPHSPASVNVPSPVPILDKNSPQPSPTLAPNATIFNYSGPISPTNTSNQFDYGMQSSPLGHSNNVQQWNRSTTGEPQGVDIYSSAALYSPNTYSGYDPPDSRRYYGDLGNLAELSSTPPTASFAAIGLPFRGLDYISNYSNDGRYSTSEQDSFWNTYDPGAFEYNPDLPFTLGDMSADDH
ncbi:hypothetical protein MSAN_01162800 [Mycena sanguinolenta]|uniref:Protein kinase domain-containing protein n=1 Tax=Mycena sanguinolenta TaxID=230812 RepID=A0A8H7D749_9AGAR|nr:hypothetical protein MSAN_01162800 [Mycena sanguinolenta]